MKELRRVFIVGILAAAPLALTVYLVLELAGWFDSLFQPAVQKIILPVFGRTIPGVGLIAGLFVIMLIGFVAPSLIGKQLLQLIERVLERVPLVKLIYSGTKQIFDAFSQSGLKKFNRVVRVRFPHSEAWTLGFVTQQMNDSQWLGIEGEWVSVFVPTTPNPTSGYLIFVKSSDVQSVDISSEEALSFIISCGLTKPGRPYPNKA